MQKSINLILVILVILTSSCAYNSKFLSPKKYDANTKSLTVKATKTDTFGVLFKTNDFTPTFVKNNVEITDTDYTLENVIFKSSNGNSLNGWMLKPKNNTVTCTIIQLHSNGGSILGNYVLMLGLLKKGYQVFVFDYSGYGFSTGKATRKNVLDDGISAVDYVKQRADVKGTKLVLFGQSLGGHLAANVGAKRNNDLDAIVIEGGFSSHKDIARFGSNPFMAFMSQIFVGEYYNGSKNIKQITKPILIIHSTDDKTIPYYMGEKLLKNANAPKELFTIKGGHIEGLSKYLDEIDLKIKNMIN